MIRPTLLVIHPYDDLYGSDRMVASVVRALRERYRCVVVLPAEGPLAELVRDAGAEVRLLALPVLRKALLSPRPLARFALSVPPAVFRMVRMIRSTRPAACYVNTISVPVALLACRLAGVRTICHTHEAESSIGRLLEIALTAPLFLAHRIVAISATAAEFTGRRFPALRARTTVVYNCVSAPDKVVPAPDRTPSPLRLLQLGRWSERKGTDLAIAATAMLRQQGIDATLDVIGGVFPGYEPFERRIRAQAVESGVADSVHFLPFVSDPSSAYDAADIVLVPSRVEPFGLVAAEAMVRQRVVVAADVDGLAEIMQGAPAHWTFTPGSAAALAASVAACVAEWPAARREAEEARERMISRFGEDAFARDLLAVVDTR